MPSINVKVPTTKVIAALEKKLKELKAHQAAWDEYTIANEQWEKNLRAALDSTWKVQGVTFRNWHSSPTLCVEYIVPKNVLAAKPKQPKTSIRNMEAIDEIENALRILKMTDEEMVSASTFKAVSRYL